MGRTSDARQRLVDAARELFGSRAYNAVGVAEIADHAGVLKGSFYHFFRSKEALALAVIDDHWERQRGEWRAILDSGGTAFDHLRSIFDTTARIQVQAMEGTGTVSGCLFGKLALEVSAVNEPMQARLQAVFEEQVEMIRAEIASAVDAGDLSVADELAAAKAIVAQLEGLVLFARLFNDPAQLDSLWKNSLQLLNAVPVEA